MAKRDAVHLRVVSSQETPLSGEAESLFVEDTVVTAEAPEDHPDDLREWERQVAVVRDRALRLLGQREHSIKQLTTKLRRKGFDEDVVAMAVGQLTESDVQSNERFAEALVRRRVDRGYGPMYIRSELREAGIDDDVSDDVLSRSAEFWMDVATRVREKKYGDLDAVDWNTQARFLARRGFPADLIYRVLGR